MEFFAIAVVTFTGLVVCWASTSRDPVADRGALRVTVLAHAVFPHVLWGIMTDRDEGDLFTFYRVGQNLLDGFWYDPERYSAEILQFVFSSDSTSFMMGSAAILLGLTVFPTAANVVVSFLAAAGQILLYRGLRDHVPTRNRWQLVAACTLVPSVSFWSSGLVKEAFAIAGLGMAVYGFSRAWAGSRRKGIAYLVVGMWMISLSKPYVLFPLLAAMAVWWFWARQSDVQRHAILVRPWRLVGIAIAASLSIVLLSYFFPRFSPDQFATEATRLRTVGAAGGSVYALSEGPADASLSGQLALAPLGMFNALFRPFVFEIRNVLMIPAAFESTALLVMFARLMLSAGPRVVVARTFAEPVLLTSAVFVVLFSVAVGLTTVNFGTLSRYRVPMLPFFAFWMLMVGDPVARRVPPTASRRGARTERRRALASSQG